MSRRRGEFEHRTSIFEGAFRAWSHLGGLDPEEMELKPPSDLDPLDFPLENDSRMEAAVKDDRSAKDPDGKQRRIYPYEPLPRTGLSHPYVQAILSPWLGPDADGDAIQLGLTTLRTWWQHRRKGESGSAVVALGSDKMKGVVDGYTRHFFNLAHCLVVNDNEQPPRTLQLRMKEFDKIRNRKSGKKRTRDSEVKDSPQAVPSSVEVDTGGEGLSALERLHASQKRQLVEVGGLNGVLMDSIHGSTPSEVSTKEPAIDMTGKCIPGKLDLPTVVNAVSSHASQLAHRGGGLARGDYIPMMAVSSGAAADFGDPNMTPVVLVSENGDIQIAMSVDGITCAHCVKIVETVLKGCNGNKSPIEGLLDAAADRVLNRILIKIDQSSNAKRIAFEAARNLSMVGYTAKAKEMSIVNAGGDKKATMDLGALSTAFEVVANTEPQDVFDWSLPCTCPDNGIVRDDCARHSQMNTLIFDAFDLREKQVAEYMAGCGKKYGMGCTCGPDCRCKNCEEHCKPQDAAVANLQPLSIPYGADPMAEQSAAATRRDSTERLLSGASRESWYRAVRNPSIMNIGNMRQMSLLSNDQSFGRAMSGLSALSVDWENMEDFDVSVDHSAHIDYSAVIANSPGGGVARVPTDGIAQNCAMMTGGACNCGDDCLCDGCPVHNDPTRRSSFRSNASSGDAAVAFKV